MVKRIKQRADITLVERSLVDSRSTAQSLIRAGRVLANEIRLDTPGQLIDQNAEIRLISKPKYVSRGGEKLEGALHDFDYDVFGLNVLDVGASTGGFTDCLLQNGANLVYAIDVGRGQLSDRIRKDPRVVVMEKINARNPFNLPSRIELIVMDLSFISLRKVIPNLMEHLVIKGKLLVLVKPQFESARSKIGKGGVIREPGTHAEIVGDFCKWAISMHFRILGIRRSHLTGSSGNKEFFVYMERNLLRE